MIIISANEEKIILLIRYMARDGLTEEEIAKKLKISKSRLCKILKENDELKNEIEYSKQLTQFAVEDALLKRALGSTSVEVKETEKKTGTEKVKVTKEVPADTSAIQFWLKNRCPDRWCDNANEHSETMEKLNSIMENITVLSEKASSKEE